MTEDNFTQCPMWGGGSCAPAPGGKDSYVVESPRAGGVYSFVKSIPWSKLHELPEDKKIRISRWIYKRNKQGASPTIYTIKLDNLLEKPMPSMIERMKMLAVYMTDNNENYVETNMDEWAHPTMLAASCSRYSRDVFHLLELLVDGGYVMRKGFMNQIFSLTQKGYEWVEGTQDNRNVPNQIFVAMWINEETKNAYEQGIKPGIIDAGFEPLRIDEKPHANKIDEEIDREIRRSCLVVADFTCESTSISGREVGIARGSVYYEVGLAKGLDIPVIFTCRSDCMEHLHFDTRQYQHIPWKEDDLESLRRSVAEFIHVAAKGGSN